MPDRFKITSDELPEVIRGGSVDFVVLNNHSIVDIEGFCGSVAEIIEGRINDYGAETRQEVLAALQELADSIARANSFLDSVAERYFFNRETNIIYPSIRRFELN